MLSLGGPQSWGLIHGPHFLTCPPCRLEQRETRSEVPWVGSRVGEGTRVVSGKKDLSWSLDHGGGGGMRDGGLDSWTTGLGRQGEGADAGLPAPGTVLWVAGALRT